MKRLKVTLTAFLLLSAVLTGCAAEKKNYVTDEIIRENASFYRGETVRFLNENRVSGGVDAITNAEGQFLYHDAFGWYGDLPIVDAVSYRGIPYEYAIPCSSSYTYTVGDDLVEEGDGFSITDAGNRHTCGAGGAGVKTITIFMPDRVEVKGQKEMDVIVYGMPLMESQEFKALCPPEKCLEGYYVERLYIRGMAEESASVEYTKTGAIATGFIGEGHISIELGIGNKIECDYTFTSETVEIDIVSQPGEILVTPIEG